MSAHTQGATVTAIAFLAGVLAGASLLVAYSVVRDGSRRNAYQDRIVAAALEEAEAEIERAEDRLRKMLRTAYDCGGWVYAAEYEEWLAYLARRAEGES